MLKGLGFRVVISRIRRRVTILITHIGGLITPLITTHEPPSRVKGLRRSNGPETSEKEPFDRMGSIQVFHSSKEFVVMSYGAEGWEFGVRGFGFAVGV